MQIPIIARRGQAKPYGSVPRINWLHPLAQGLAVYVYDVGGVVVDLINGGLGKVTSNVTPVANATSQFGGGIKYPFTNGTGAGYVNLPPNGPTTTIAVAAPYSWAVGTVWNNTTVPANSATAIACVTGTNDSENTSVAFFSQAGAAQPPLVIWDNGLTSNPFATGIAATFQTWVVNALTSTTANFYASGKLDSSLTGITSTTFTFSGEQGLVILNSGSRTGTDNGGFSGQIPFFAAWKRSLTAAEASQLHNDPYCFLIYPEDEIFAMLVGVASVTPPGPGPNFLTSLLPMMGVG